MIRLFPFQFTGQIILGFGAVILILILLSLLVKRVRSTALLSALLLGVFCTGIVFLCSHIETETMNVDVENDESIPAEADDILGLAAVLTANGETEGARRLLEQYRGEFFCNSYSCLIEARILALEGNDVGAECLYKMLANAEQEGPETEQAVEERKILHQIREGKKPREEMQKAIASQVRSIELPENLQSAGDVYCEIEKLDYSLRQDRSLRAAAAIKVQREIKEYMRLRSKAPSLFAIEELELSYMKALAIGGLYDQMIGDATLMDNSHMILILAELDRQGKVRSTALKKNATLQKSALSAEEVLNWLRKEKERTTFKGEEKDIIETAVDDLEETADRNREGMTQWVMTKMLSLAEKTGEKEASKLYLTLSRMAWDDDNAEQANVWLKKALMTADDSQDSGYRGSVNALNRIIQNKDDPEALKDVDSHVYRMVDLMSPPELQAINNLSLSLADVDYSDSVTEILTDADWNSDEANTIMEEDGASLETLEEDDARKELEILDYEENGEENRGTEENNSVGTWDETQDYLNEGQETDQEYMTETLGYSQFISTKVNQIQASINIVSVDATEFETVSAIVAMDETIAQTEEEFREYLTLYDCDIEIMDYTVEKLENTGVNVILCCDNSGSMAGDKVENLKSALSAFTQNLDADVRVGIVAFDDTILAEGSTLLGSSAADLQSAIEQMTDRGGTNIKGAVDASVDKMQATGGLNIVIVMSDGQDSMPGMSEMEELRMACEDRGVTIYTMGLGADVDASVLKLYSDYGGGEYAFVSDSGSLLSFYSYLYNLGKNRFRITYEARDTIQTQRELLVSYNEDHKIYGKKEYQLYDTSAFSENDLGEKYSCVLEDVGIFGLDTRLLVKSSLDQEVYLLGQGLRKDKDIRIMIRAGKSYDLPCEFVDEEHWKVTIPAKVSCGQYDVEVTVDGKRAVLESGLVITDDNLHIVRFGQYVFTTTCKEDLGGRVRLSGYIRMNDWIDFYEHVDLIGNLESDSEIRMESGRTAVRFRGNDSETTGVARLFARTGLVFAYNPIEEFILYRNENIRPDSDEFRVDAVATRGGAVLLKDVFSVTTPGVKLYPDRLLVDFQEFSTALPLQDKLIKAAGLDTIFSYNIDHEEKLIISDVAVDCKIDISVESSDKKEYRETRVGNFRLLLNLEELGVHIDTSVGDYSLKVITNIGMLVDGVGLEVSWKNNSFDGAQFHLDEDVTTSVNGIPVTFEKFFIGISGVAETEGEMWEKIMQAKLKGGCDISVAKVSAVLPKLARYLKTKDAAVCTLKETALTLCFKNPYISISTDVKLFEEIDLGSVVIELGQNFTYENELLWKEEMKVSGMRMAVDNMGITWESDNVKISVAADKELSITNKVFGVTAGGHVFIDLRWWIFVNKFEKEGKFFIGVYEQHNGNKVFAVRATDMDKLYDVSFKVGEAV